MPEADRQLLQVFVKDLNRLLFIVVRRPRETWIVLERHRVILEAWQAGEPRFGELSRQLEDPEWGPRLESAALTGAPLRFKMAGWRGALQRFLRRPGRNALKLVLRWAKVALGSLATIFGAVEPIKEFKEALEAEVEDRGNRRRRGP